MFQVGLDERQNLLGGISEFQIIPYPNRELGGIDSETSCASPDFSIIGQIQRPQLGTVLTI